MQRIIHIPKVGDILFRKQKRYVRVSIKVGREGNITVNVPKQIPYQTALEWVLSKTDWIISSTEKINKKASNQTVFCIGSTYKTYKHTLHIVYGRSSKIGEKINIGIPSSLSNEDIEKPEIQLSIRKIIDKVYTQEAKEELPIRICKLADQFGFQFNRLSFRNNKSRWGSCSGDNNISLNIHLMRLPSHLIDYVILHELCHTIEKNHSTSFWNLLDSVCKDCKALRRELKEYTTYLY